MIHKHLNTVETKMVWVPCGAVGAHEARGEVTGLGSGSGLMCRIFTKCSETVSTLTAVVQDCVQTLTPLSRFLWSRPGQKENSLFNPFNFAHADSSTGKCVTSGFMWMELEGFLSGCGDLSSNTQDAAAKMRCQDNKSFCQLGTQEDTWTGT